MHAVETRGERPCLLSGVCVRSYVSVEPLRWVKILGNFHDSCVAFYLLQGMTSIRTAFRLLLFAATDQCVLLLPHSKLPRHIFFDCLVPRVLIVSYLRTHASLFPRAARVRERRSSTFLIITKMAEKQGDSNMEKCCPRGRRISTSTEQLGVAFVRGHLQGPTHT